MYLNAKQLTKYRNLLNNRLGHQVLLQTNGIFDIYNISEYEADRVVRVLRQKEFVEFVNKTKSGNYDFSHYSFDRGFAEPKSFYNVRGMIKLLPENEAYQQSTSTKLNNYVNECIEDLKDFLIMDPEDGDDIDVYEMDTTVLFGKMELPKTDMSNFRLYLSKHMYDEPEKNIKNTIYHELAHYIVDKYKIKNNIIVYKNHAWFWNNVSREEQAKYRSHGAAWYEVADQIEMFTGQKITRTSPYEDHEEVKKVADERIRFAIRCKKCGYVFKYQKETDFVKEVIDGNGKTKKWHCNCGSHDFEIIEKKDKR